MKQGWSGLFSRLLILSKTRKEIFATHCFPASSTDSQVHSRSFLLNYSEGGKHLWGFFPPQKKNHIEKIQFRGLLVYISFSHSISGVCWSRVQTQLSFLSHKPKDSPLSVTLFLTSALQQSLPVPRKSQQESKEHFHGHCQYFTWFCWLLFVCSCSVEQRELPRLTFVFSSCH